MKKDIEKVAVDYLECSIAVSELEAERQRISSELDRKRKGLRELGMELSGRCGPNIRERFIVVGDSIVVVTADTVRVAQPDTVTRATMSGE